MGGGSAAKESERSSGASESLGLIAETLRWRESFGTKRLVEDRFYERYPCAFRRRF